jgi:hypothetical protein
MVREICEVDLNVSEVGDARNHTGEDEDKYTATPDELIRAVSRTLGGQPDIRLKSIKWVQTHDTNHSFGEATREVDRRTQYRMQAGRLALLYRKGRIEATVENYDNNPRLAVETVERFIEQLRNQHEAYRVELIKTPFDIDPASRLVGRALGKGGGNRARSAEFAFVMSREIEL